MSLPVQKIVSQLRFPEEEFEGTLSTDGIKDISVTLMASVDPKCGFKLGKLRANNKAAEKRLREASLKGKPFHLVCRNKDGQKLESHGLHIRYKQSK